MLRSLKGAAIAIPSVTGPRPIFIAGSANSRYATTNTGAYRRMPRLFHGYVSRDRAEGTDSMYEGKSYQRIQRGHGLNMRTSSTIWYSHLQREQFECGF